MVEQTNSIELAKQSPRADRFDRCIDVLFATTLAFSPVAFGVVLTHDAGEEVAQSADDEFDGASVKRFEIETKIGPGGSSK